MAFSMNGGGGGGRRRRHSDFGTMSEINIVPLVDVVLVLLIIFMLTAQVMEFGLEIDVPKVSQEKASAEELPVISIAKSGTTYLNEAPININEIGDTVKKRFGENAKAVYIKADKNVLWDVLAQVVSEVNRSKFEVRLVTKPEDVSERRRR
ncbi:MAG: biopolymer transporter ExbD [Bryobacteraceae bacterium]|nr:biopolymer transporter ExbD [Bryobacteraceae bacterium]